MSMTRKTITIPDAMDSCVKAQIQMWSLTAQKPVDDNGLCLCSNHAGNRKLLKFAVI